MKTFSPDWPTHSVAETLRIRMQVKPERQHWSFDSVAAAACKRSQRVYSRKPMTQAELQARENARLLARLQALIQE